jgi:hypothetical protein
MTFFATHSMVVFEGSIFFVWAEERVEEIAKKMMKINFKFFNYLDFEGFLKNNMP